MNVSFFCDWAIPPAAAEVNKDGCILFLGLEEEDLESKVSHSNDLRMETYFFFPFASIGIFKFGFYDACD